MLSSLFYCLLTLLLVIFVHESGHFLVARWCGVKVLRFSFGFGKILGRWSDKHGTEFTWSLLPLGGYVKFLDENESPVPTKERHRAFNRQPMWARVAIIVAGPLCNFLFAFFVLWLVAIIGIKSFAPRIASIQPNTVAAQAHLGTMQEIIAVDGKSIRSWRDVHYAMMPLLGSTHNVSITLKSLQDQTENTHYLQLAQWNFDPKHGDLLESLGIVPLFPKLSIVIDFITPESPAQLGGLESGDELIAMDHHPISDWRMLIDYVQNRPDQDVTIEIYRQGKSHQLAVHLQTGKDKSGFLGIRAKSPEIPADWLRMERSGPIDAIGQAWWQTRDFTLMTMTLIGRTVSGKLPLEQLSGPVGIAKAAGESARIGIVYYLFFIALLSISIGVLNLLPIPMLDGGHLLYELIEFIIRRPLSKEFKLKGIFLGMLCVLGLTIVALFNDLT